MEYRAPEGSRTPVDTKVPVLEVKLSLDYPQRAGVLRNVAFCVNKGEIVGLVGASGSGKSTIAMSILRLLAHSGARTTGTVLLAGSDLMQFRDAEMRNVRGKQISLVPQSASLALNGALRIRTQLREAWKAHSNTAWDAELPRIRGLLNSCGLPDDDAFLDRYPDQISLGQAQRVLIVMAVLHAPELVIADEPTSALDVVTQTEVLQLLKEFNQRQQMSILLISHDLAVVAAICHRILILAESAIVESGTVEEVFATPSHRYTQALVSAAKRLQYGYLQFDRHLPENQGS